MATPAQIAARKKFAERARSGELAKMRKKATKRNPTPTKARAVKSNPSSKNTVLGKANFTVSKWKRGKNTVYGNPVYDFELIYEFNGNMYSGKTKPNSSFVYQYGNQIKEGDSIKATLEKTPSGRVYMTDIQDVRQMNPAATRAPARSRTKLVSNGREKNPVVKIKDILEYSRFPYKVQISENGKNFKDLVGTMIKENAIAYAKSYAKLNPKEYVRVFKIDVSEDLSDEVKKKS